MDASTELDLLKRELEETRRRLEIAERENLHEKQRAARAEEEKARAEEEMRKTTLVEYIEACHDLVFTKFTVETNSTMTSKGSITNPGGKRCPPRLEPWADFLDEQQTILGTLFSKFPPQAEAFRSLHYLRTRGEVLATRRVGDEESLKLVLQDLVAEPVTLILERLQDEDDLMADFDIGGGNFGSAGSPRTPDGNKFRPDQIYAYKRDADDGRTMAYVIEYKPPHKLTLPHFRVGLRPMNIYKEVVNRATIPSSEDEVPFFEYQADRLVAAAVTQTFDYMIQAGLTYGCVATGEAIVFLKIDWAEPITLFYHLAEPGPEVDEHKDNFLCCTVVSQMLAFTILALDSQARQVHGQDDRQEATDSLKMWAVDWESILRSVKSSGRPAPPTSPAYEPRTYKHIDRSPYPFRHPRRRAPSGGSCKTTPAGWGPSTESDDDDRENYRMPDSPTPSQPRNARRDLARRPRGDSGAGSSSRSGRAPSRQYCTQSCLLGLVSGGVLDEKCPNVTLHRGTDGSRRHPVDHTAWLGLLREQLRRTLDEGVVPLGKQGAGGVVFQITLLVYGYTFVSKATTSSYVRELEHEARIYEHLRPLQGVRVPVLLGAIDLREVGRRYYYAIQVQLVHLMLLSWGGSSLCELEGSDKAGLKQEVVQAVRALHMRGVVHTDVRAPNVLWNEATGRVMVIDFEQAVLTGRPRPPLDPALPNKRVRPTLEATNTTTDDSKPTPKSSPRSSLIQRKMQEDIIAAVLLF